MVFNNFWNSLKFCHTLKHTAANPHTESHTWKLTYSNSHITTCIVAPWCSGYDYSTTSFNKVWTQILRRLKSCSQCVRDLRWWGSLTMVPAGNKAKTPFVGQPFRKNNSSSSSSSLSPSSSSSSVSYTESHLTRNYWNLLNWTSHKL